MYYIGIDPGQEGAIAVMGKGDLKVFDMPVVSAKGKPQLDFANLGRILRECSQRGDCIADYLRLDTTKAFLEELSKTMGIPIVSLVEVKTGRNGGVRCACGGENSGGGGGDRN